MPIVSYFIVVGSALLALLFATDHMAPHRGDPAVRSSSTIDLLTVRKEARREIAILTVREAPAPDMSAFASMENAAADSIATGSAAGPVAATASAQQHVDDRPKRKRAPVARHRPPTESNGWSDPFEQVWRHDAERQRTRHSDGFAWSPDSRAHFR